MDIVLFLSSLILRKSGGISVCKVLMPIKYSAGIQYLYQGKINVCKALMPIKYSAGKEWLFPSSKIWIAVDISKWTGFSVLAHFFTEENGTYIVMSSLSD